MEPARSLLLGRCVPLLGRSVPRNAVQPRMALHIIINSGSWAHLALRLTRFDGGVVAVLHGAEPGRAPCWHSSFVRYDRRTKMSGKG